VSNTRQIGLINNAGTSLRTVVSRGGRLADASGDLGLCLLRARCPGTHGEPWITMSALSLTVHEKTFLLTVGYGPHLCPAGVGTPHTHKHLTENQMLDSRQSAGPSP
jgi:hypothetical protein